MKNYKGDYILNGDWTIKNPGVYKLNGHYAVYKRSSSENVIKIKGPIDAPLTIEVLGYNPLASTPKNLEEFTLLKGVVIFYKYSAIDFDFRNNFKPTTYSHM